MNKPRVRIVMPSFDHGHNYSQDLLAFGFCELAEKGLIEVELTPKPKHVSLPEDPSRPGSWYPAPGSRDACQLACDSALPDFRLSGPPDLMIGGVHCLDDLKKAGGSCPVAIIDGFDDGTDFRSKANDAAPGRVCAYFKRELGLGQTWAIPLPLTCPEKWIPGPWHTDRKGVTYFTSIHQGNAASRLTIAEDLRRLGPEVAAVVTEDDRSKRPTPEQLHRKLWKSLVGIHWNSLSSTWKGGFDGHRLPENLAHGVAVVSQRPFIEYPHPFTHGENILFVDTPDEVGKAVSDLLSQPDKALKIALAGHLHFKRFHSSRARALSVLKRCGFDVVV